MILKASRCLRRRSRQVRVDDGGDVTDYLTDYDLADSALCSRYLALVRPLLRAIGFPKPRVGGSNPS
jgi:hypothetical protein